MMSKKFHVAVLLSAFVAAGAGAQPFDAGVSRAEVNADLAAWKQAGLDKLSGGDAGPDTFSSEYRQAYKNYLQLRLGADYRESTALTRDQVRADLALWKRAGLDKLERGDGGTDTFSSQYRATYDTYRHLRDGEQYQQEVGLTRAEADQVVSARSMSGLSAAVLPAVVGDIFGMPPVSSNWESVRAAVAAGGFATRPTVGVDE